MRSLDAGLDVEATADQSCMQDFNASFNACEFIMRAHYPGVGKAIRSLLLWNASLEEILDFVV